MAADIRKRPQKFWMLKGFVSLDVLSVEHSDEGINHFFSRSIRLPSSDSFSMASEKSFVIGEPFGNT